MNRAEKTWSSRIRFDFLPQPRHRAIDRTCGTGIEKAPHFPEKLITKHNTALALGQDPQNLEFAMGEMQIASRARGGATSEINRDISEPDRRDRRLRCGAGQY